MEEGRWEKMRERRRERHVGSGREEGREILEAATKGSSKEREREGAKGSERGKGGSVKERERELARERELERRDG